MDEGRSILGPQAAAGLGDRFLPQDAGAPWRRGMQGTQLRAPLALPAPATRAGSAEGLTGLRTPESDPAKVGSVDWGHPTEQ